jgi:hypothetical protein
MSGPPWTPAGDVQKIFDHIRVEDSGCWTWTGTTLPSGVGRIRWEGQQTAVHRIAYELFVGPIAEGMHLDHVCHNADPACPGGPCAHRRCLNPHHMEPVTVGENVLRGKSNSANNARKTHCDHGHEFTPENTYDYHGCRKCMTCARARSAAYEEKRKARRRAAREAVTA